MRTTDNADPVDYIAQLDIQHEGLQLQNIYKIYSPF